MNIVILRGTIVNTKIIPPQATLPPFCFHLKYSHLSCEQCVCHRGTERHTAALQSASVPLLRCRQV